MRMIELHGATYDDSSGERIYKELGRVWVNPERVCFVYDHTVVIGAQKLRVMESGEEIIKCLTFTE